MNFLLDRGSCDILDRTYVSVRVNVFVSPLIENVCFNSSGSLYGSVYGIFD